MDQIFSVP